MLRFCILIFWFLFLSVHTSADLRKLVNPSMYTGSEFIPYGYSLKYEPVIEKNAGEFFEDYILRKVRNYYLNKNQNVDFSHFKINGRYHLIEMPCIKIYSIKTPGIKRTFNFEQFTDILVNECDSSLYFFEDDLYKFVTLFSNEIKCEIRMDQIINIIDLYLNSKQYLFPYFILRTAKEIETIYNREYLRIGKEALADTLNPIYGEYKDRKKGLKKAYEIVKPPEIKRDENNCTLKFYTFTLGGDKIEYWQIRLSNNNIEIMKRITIFDFYKVSITQE